MKTILLGLHSVLGLHSPPTPLPTSVSDLKTYITIREQLKAADPVILKKIAANPGEKNVRRGISAYYLFLKTRPPGGNPAAAKATVNALETAANTYMDPISFVKLAQVYARDTPDFNVKQNRTRALKYLSIAWEIADLSDRATGDNALLTLIINNSLGIGDGFLVDNTQGRFDVPKALAAIRGDVLNARLRFKKLYKLPVRDEFTGSTNVERHYGR